MLPAAQPVAIAATSDIPQADAPIAAAKADRMVIASLIQKLRLKLFLFIDTFIDLVICDLVIFFWILFKIFVWMSSPKGDPHQIVLNRATHWSVFLVRILFTDFYPYHNL